MAWEVWAGVEWGWSGVKKAWGRHPGWKGMKRSHHRSEGVRGAEGGDALQVIKSSLIA